MTTKNKINKSIKFIPTKNIINQYCTNTTTTTNNNNVPIEYTNFQPYQKNILLVSNNDIKPIQIIIKTIKQAYIITVLTLTLSQNKK